MLFNNWVFRLYAMIRKIILKYIELFVIGS